MKERTTTTRKINACAASERGASEFFMMIMMSVLLAFAGLAYDAGMAFNSKRAATNIAASAARAGADTIDTDALYGESLPRLSDQAEGVASAAISRAGGTEVEVKWDGEFEMFVKVSQVHNTTFLNLVGIDSMTVTGEATALVEHRDG